MSTLIYALRYPLQGSIFVAIVAYVLLVNLARVAGLFGIALYWFVVVGALGYTVVIFRACANGRRTAPTMTANETNLFASGQLLQTVALLLLAVLLQGLVSRYTGPPLSYVALALIWLWLPAALSLNLLNGRLDDAVNPVQIWTMIRELGRPYFLMPLAAVGATLVQSIIDALPVPHLLGEAMGAYLLLATLAFWARLLFEHRDRVGLEATSDASMREQLDAKDEDRRRNGIMDRAFAESRTSSDRAMAVVDELFDGKQDAVETREWAFERSRGWDNAMVALRLGQTLIDRHLTLGNDARALEIIDFGISREAAFRPAGPNATLKAASVALKHARPGIATQLLGDFGARFPDNPQRVAAALTGATIAWQKTGDMALARRLFDSVASEPQAVRHPRYDALKKALAGP